MFDEFDTNKKNEDTNQLNYNPENSEIYEDYKSNNENKSYNFWEEKTQEEASCNNNSYDEYSAIKNNESESIYYNKEDISLNNEIPYQKPEEVKENKVKKVTKFIALALVFGLLAGVGFQGFQEAYRVINPEAVQAFKLSDDGALSNGSSAGTKKIESTVIEDDAKELVTDITNVAEKVMPSIVSIDTTTTVTDWGFFGNYYEREYPGSGSGIIVGLNEEELLIVTNNHVVSDANKVNVTFIDEEKVEAKVKGTDTNADLAVISIDVMNIKEETLKSIKVAALGDSDQVKVGQMSIAIGNAMGYGQSVTAGYISAKNRVVEVEGRTMTLLQTDAAINPGNSGGALLNIYGEVIGINAVKYSSAGIEGMGYAIPISSATPIINDLMNKEIIKESERGFLGVSGEDVTEEISKQLNIPVGVYITGVSEESAAMKSGLYAGDIITAVNGTEVFKFNELRDKISSYKGGEEVELTIKRSMQGVYREQIISVILGSRIE